MLLISQFSFSQQTHATIFLPGIVSTDANDFNACFSNDSQSFYFSRTIAGNSQILATSRLNANWSTPEKLAFCKSEFSYADPAFSPTGELYFISTMPTSSADTTRDYNIWKTFFLEGKWREPVPVPELNSPENEFYISFTDTGDAYFSSSRPGGLGEEDIYFAQFVNGTYKTPINVGEQVNSIHSEYDPFINNDGKLLIFASSGRADTFGKADLYWAKKRNDGWDAVNHFGPQINTPTRDFCPYLTPNDKFFFSSEGQVKVSRWSLAIAH